MWGGGGGVERKRRDGYQLNGPFLMHLYKLNFFELLPTKSFSRFRETLP